MTCSTRETFVIVFVICCKEVFLSRFYCALYRAFIVLFIALLLCFLSRFDRVFLRFYLALSEGVFYDVNPSFNLARV